MAKTLKKQTSLNKSYKEGSKEGLILTTIGILFLALSPLCLLKSENIPSIILFFLGVICVKRGLRVIKRANMFRLGAIGENLVNQTLSDMGKDFYVFNDVTVLGSQIDHIVVCPSGVYTIETKHYQGTIYGNAENKKWIQVVGRKRAKFYNPVKQGKRHSLALHKFLKETCSREHWVNTIVVFTHPDVQLKIHSPKVPVIQLNEMGNLFSKQKTSLTPSQYIEIVDCLLYKLTRFQDNP